LLFITGMSASHQLLPDVLDPRERVGLVGVHPAVVCRDTKADPDVAYLTAWIVARV
jgi:hypothetical protein